MERESSPASVVLSSWLHLSDIHFGHGPLQHRELQSHHLRALLEDVKKQVHEKNLRPPDVLMMTGDIAFSGGTQNADGHHEYALARAFVDRIVDSFESLTMSRVFVVPGNHDACRTKENDPFRPVLDGVRSRALEFETGYVKQALRRFARYSDFIDQLGLKTVTPSHWESEVKITDDLKLRVVGMNTALLSNDHLDHGALRVPTGWCDFRVPKSNELVVLLTHHPLNQQWINQEDEIQRLLRSRIDIHLCGHVHDHVSTFTAPSTGPGIVTVQAGASHMEFRAEPADVHEDARAALARHGHSYSVFQLVQTDGQLNLHVYPRRWSARANEFRTDVDSVRDGADFATHALPRIRPPAIRPPSATGRPSPPAAAPLDGTFTDSSAEAIDQQVRLINGAKKLLRHCTVSGSMNTGGPRSTFDDAFNARVDKEAADKSSAWAVRVIATPSDEHRQQRLAHLVGLACPRFHVREVRSENSSLPRLMNFLIADNSEVVVMLHGTEGPYGITSSTPGFVRAFVEHFDSMWAHLEGNDMTDESAKKFVAKARTKGAGTTPKRSAPKGGKKRARP